VYWPSFNRKPYTLCNGWLEVNSRLDARRAIIDSAGTIGVRGYRWLGAPGTLVSLPPAANGLRLSMRPPGRIGSGNCGALATWMHGLESSSEA
jgi:hypothetical protein